MYSLKWTKTSLEVFTLSAKNKTLLKIHTLNYAAIFHLGFNHLNCIIFKVEVYFTVSYSI